MSCSGPVQLFLVLLKLPGATPECVSYHLQVPQPYLLSFSQYLALFGMTCVLEAPVYRAVMKGTKAYRGSWSLAGRVLLLNLVTHPLVCFGFPSFAARAGIEGGPSLALSEAFAVLAEGLVLNLVWDVKWSRALLGALAANLISWWLGTWLLSWVWT